MGIMLSLKDVSKYYPDGNGGQIPVVTNLDFKVRMNEFLCIVGRSGCGKTTTLRMIAGLEPASSGEIHLNEKRITAPGPERCVVFQKYTLFPWRRVLDNVSFGPEMQGVPKKKRYSVARKYLNLVGLSDCADSYPHELSGGMQQRVAVARALAADPEVLLMDEPFGALDARTRESLQKELLRIWREHRKTVLFVTHSINEAITLADRIVVMQSGNRGIFNIVDNPLARPRDITGEGAVSFYRQIDGMLEAN